MDDGRTRETASKTHVLWESANPVMTPMKLVTLTVGRFAMTIIMIDFLISWSLVYIHIANVHTYVYYI